MKKSMIVLSIFFGSIFGSPEGIFKNALEMKSKGFVDEAKSLLVRALSENPKKNLRFQILQELAEVHLFFREPAQPESALVYLKEAEALYPITYRGMDRVYYLLGMTYLKLGRYLDAAKYFETVATRFRKSKYFEQSLIGVEEAFTKNFREIEAYAGDEPITKIEVDKRIEEMPALTKSRFETPEGRRELIESMVDEVLVVKEAENRKLYERADVQKQLKEAKTRIYVRTMYNDMIEKADVTEKEAREFYNQNKETMFKVPERVTIRRVVLDSLSKAEEVYKLALAGRSMDSLAMEYSVTPDGKQGGLLGPLTQDSRPKEIVEQAFKMKEGEISRPILADNKYWVFKLEKREKAYYRPFEEMKESIIQRLKSDKGRTNWENFKKELRKKYGVKFSEDLNQEAKEKETKLGIELKKE